MIPPVNFLLIGIIGIGMIWLLERRFWKHWVGWLAAMAVAIGAVLVVMLLNPPRVLGSSSWYYQTPWREVILFLFMVLGMLSEAISFAVQERRRRTLERRQTNPRAKPGRLDLDRWEMALPLLVAVPVFLALLSQVEDESVGPLTLAMAFQNGFMWRAILKKLE